MKTTSTLFAALVAATFASSAFAQSYASPTRAEVKAEAVQAVHDGEVVGNLDHPAAANTDFGSGRTRSEVRADISSMDKAGRATSDINYPMTPQAESTKTRAEVQAEFTQARAMGEIQRELN